MGFVFLPNKIEEIALSEFYWPRQANAPVRLTELTEKFQLDKVRLLNQSNSIPADWARLGTIDVWLGLCDWLRRTYTKYPLRSGE